MVSIVWVLEEYGLIKLVLEYCLEIKIKGFLVLGGYYFFLIDFKILYFVFVFIWSNKNGNVFLVVFYFLKRKEFL